MGGNSKQLSMALRKLGVIENDSFAQYFPMILTMLVKVICTRTDSGFREAFESLVVVIDRVSKLPEQDTPKELLDFYVNFVFENPTGDLVYYPYQALASQFSDLVSGQVSNN